MIEGFFIRSGDKTTCGGVVLSTDESINLFGFAHARAGDPVTCGVTGGTFQIVGGIQGFDSHGRLMAGTLDSISSCPCRARLINSQTFMRYEGKSEPSVSRTAGSLPHQPANHAPRASSVAHGHPVSAPAGETGIERCSGCFQLFDQRGMPCGTRQYALLKNDCCLAGDTLNEEAYSHICYSANTTNLVIATGAATPILE